MAFLCHKSYLVIFVVLNQDEKDPLLPIIGNFLYSLFYYVAGFPPHTVALLKTGRLPGAQEKRGYS